MKKLVPLLLLLVMITAGCDLIGLTATSTTEPPVISSFDADPPTVAAGESSTLKWNVSGATKVSIDQGIGNVALTGNRAVMPGATTVYTLTATNAAGASAMATAQIIVSGVPSPPASLPVINSFTASPPEIAAGSSATLSWNISNATSVTIAPGVGTYASSGSTIVSPAATTSYILTATNTAGSTTAAAQVTVSGTPLPTGLPVVNYFTANPPIISSGSSTTLSWDVSNATSVTIDNGVGSVGSAGTTSVSPAASTNYTLTATNAAGWYSLTIAVLVAAAPPSGLPDLVITSISRTGDTVNYKIKNQGDADAGPSTSRLTVDGVVKANDSVGSLTQGQEVTRSFAGYSYACSGTSDSLAVQADIGGAVTEISEANNSLTVSWLCIVYIPPPVIILPLEKTVTLYSISGEDGHVRSNGSTNQYPNVGDDPSNIALQAFLSFDISGIPSSATIKSASMDVSTGDTLGDPFGKLKWMRVYNHQYGTLGSEDFTPGFPTGAMYTYASEPVASFTSSTLINALQARVSAANPRFQVRLQFQNATNGDGITDALRLGQGQPKLVVTYQ